MLVGFSWWFSEKKKRYRECIGYIGSCIFSRYTMKEHSKSLSPYARQPTTHSYENMHGVGMTKMPQNRTIIHIDMDAFYAAIEQRDQPELLGRAVIVGGSPDRRGVVASCSYEARQFRIHSAMPSSTAFRLCPQAVFLPAPFDVYQAVSPPIMQHFPN